MKFNLICLLLFIAQISVAENNCVVLTGVIKDQNTETPLYQTKVECQNKGNILSTTTSDKSGNFKIELSCEATHLSIKRKGYRNLTFALNNTKLSESFFVELFMIAIEKEEEDRPYLQSEQKDLVLNNNLAKTSKKSARTFIIKDAFTKQKIDAKLCLFYTQKDTVECFEIKKEKKQSIVFEQEDIVALEVDAKGYETYSGNIQIRNLNITNISHEIFLLQSIAIISIRKPTGHTDSSSLEIMDLNGKKQPIKQNENYFFTLLKDEGNYLLKLKLSGKYVENTLAAKHGFNFHVFEIPELAKPLATDLAVSNQTVFEVFFTQGKYQLQEIQKETLNTLAGILKANPNTKIKIIGHTDNVGNQELNVKLSEFRAKVCYQYLISKEIESERISYQGIGSSKPITNNDTEENKIKNRRVEISLLK